MNRRQFLARAGLATLAGRLLAASGNAFGSPLEAEAGISEEPLTLWYERPAGEWHEALPLGNGRIGAMVFGGVSTERIQLNEATLWGGKPHDYTNPDALKNLAAIRQCIFAEDMQGAERLAPSLLGKPFTLYPYLPFCDLQFDFYTQTLADHYRRSLDLRTAIAHVDYQFGEIRFAREAFLSYPDQVLVLRFSANRPGQQSFRLSLSTPHDHVEVTASAAAISLSGQLWPHTPPPDCWTATWEGPGLKFAAHLEVQNIGGSVRVSDHSLMIDGADEVTILVDLATSFVDYRNMDGDPEALLANRMRNRQRSWSELRARHVADYGALFHRVAIQLADPPPSSSLQPTDQQLAGSAARPSLMALFYQVGRYLLISASRSGGQPANLQGIWNESLWPPWGSKWTTNINLEMNYWPAETGALPECMEPFYDLLAGVRATGADVARVHYGCKGFVLHHNTDLWRAAAPVDGSWGIWPVGGAWLSLQAWEHYAFSLDQEFLRTTAYPALKESVEFMLDFLVEIPAGRPFAGHLATNPTTSPENAFILPDGVHGRLTYATAMDIEIVGELFEKFALSARALGVDASLLEAAEAARKRLPPLQINRDGELQEWIGDYRKTEAQHRHLSHLYGLYPGNSISLESTPALAAGAKRSLDLRGDGDGPMSWFQAWRAALWARLRDGDRAHRILGNLLAHATTPDMLHDHWYQIDGHLGGPAAIAEMLIQSHRSEIELLPALPGAWGAGSVRGLRARGGATVDFAWAGGSLISATVYTSRTGKLRLRYKELSAEIPGEANGSYIFDYALRRQT